VSTSRGRRMIVILFVLLVSAVGVLLYRVLDAGISLTFAQDEIEQLRKANEVVIRYHRTRCEDFDDESEAGFFKKDGFWVISGVEFLCEPDESGVFYLLAQ